MVVVVVNMVSINGLFVHYVDDVEGVHVVAAVGVVVAAAAIWVVVVVTVAAVVVVAAVCVVDLTVAAVVAAAADGLLLLPLELLLLLLLQGLLLLFVGHRCQAFFLRSLIFPSIANTQKENKFRFLQKPSSPHHFQV